MRTISAFVLAALVVAAVPTSAQAQVLGTFRWKLEPYGSVLNLTLTQKGNLFEVEGFEFQCGGNLSLPVTGLIVPQTNGTFFFGLTSINENGRGLHTRAYMTTANNFGGTWSDNAGNLNQPYSLPDGATAGHLHWRTAHRSYGRGPGQCDRSGQHPCALGGTGGVARASGRARGEEAVA